LQSGYRIPIKKINNRDMISQDILLRKLLTLKTLNSKYLKNMGLKTMKMFQGIIRKKSGMIVEFKGPKCPIFTQ
jgi:hypothetical protein